MKRLLTLILATSPLPLLAQTAVSADTPGQTAGGVTYVQPKDWTIATRGPATIFSAPEANFNVAVIAVGSAATASDAAVKAWSIYRPGTPPVLRLASSDAPSSGWDERVALSYETPPTAKSLNSALALRRGTDWTVMIVDGSDGTASIR